MVCYGVRCSGQLARIVLNPPNIFQVWSTLAGYEQQAKGFMPIQNGNILNE